MRNVIFRAVFLVALATVALSPSVAEADEASSGLPRLEVAKEYKLPPSPTATGLAALLVGDAPTAVAWSPDGKELAAFSSYGQNLTVWNVNGDVIKVLHPVISYLHNSLSFLNDDELLTQSGDTRVIPANAHLAFDVWNIPKGTVIKKVDGPEPIKDWGANTPEAYAVSPDGSLAVSLAQRTGLGKFRENINEPLTDDMKTFHENPTPIYSTRTWDIIERLPVYVPQSAAFSPDGKQIAFGSASKIFIYDTATWQLLKSIVTCGEKISPINTLAYSPSGDFIVVGMTMFGAGVPPCAVSIFRVADGTQIGAYPDNKIGGPWKVLWHSTGKFIVIAPHDHTLRIWNPAKPDDPGKTIHDVNSMCLAFSPDGKQLAACNSNHQAITVFNITL